MSLHTHSGASTPRAAVILDVVSNRFGPSDLDSWRFDGWHADEGGGFNRLDKVFNGQLQTALDAFNDALWTLPAA